MLVEVKWKRLINWNKAVAAATKLLFWLLLNWSLPNKAKDGVEKVMSLRVKRKVMRA
ncbi:hypothetical protein JCM19053_3033 [Vibrio sp. JCM 19053]|nr:hypothetical protein JCM19053_3033 [Vibrio sp. JCM 19053]